MKRSFCFDGVTVYHNDLDSAKQYLIEKHPLISQSKVEKGQETDYGRVFTYFPIKEILPEDIPYIYDYKRKGAVSEVASLTLRRTSKYKSYTDKIEVPSIHFWFHWSV